MDIKKINYFRWCKTVRQSQIYDKLDDKFSKDRKDDKVSKDEKAGRDSTTLRQIDDKVQSGLRPDYKTRALCRQSQYQSNS